MKGKFPQKMKKLCCVGEPDSGKTSWLAPFQGIISQDKLATVTRDKHFSASMLNEDTECLFVDEWPPDALSADDAKRILQGGYLAIPQKHKEPTHFIFKSPAYITCNEIPSFSDVDSTAIEARLEVFQTKSLPTKNPNATTWLRKHCMDCFHWAAERLRGVPIFDDEAFGDLNCNEADAGAIYSDFNTERAARLLDLDAVDSLQFSQDITNTLGEASCDLQPGTVPREVVDQAVIDYEDEQKDEWQRPETDYFIASGEINCFRYYRAVNLLTISKGKWEALKPTEEDLQRFRRRRRIGWGEPDTMYDAWLLIEKTPRKQFHMEGFKDHFPTWEIQMDRLFGSDRESKLVDSDGSEVSASESEQPQSSSTPVIRRRPRTMVERQTRRILSSEDDEGP